jgi:hypothetical protein
MLLPKQRGRLLLGVEWQNLGLHASKLRFVQNQYQWRLNVLKKLL